jgi:hypothetical protein
MKHPSVEATLLYLQMVHPTDFLSHSSSCMFDFVAVTQTLTMMAVTSTAMTIEIMHNAVYFSGLNNLYTDICGFFGKNVHWLEDFWCRAPDI